MSGVPFNLPFIPLGKFHNQSEDQLLDNATQLYFFSLGFPISVLTFNLYDSESGNH